MADSAPMLEKLGESNEAPINTETDVQHDLLPDSAFEQCLGDQFGLIQLLEVVLISLSWAFDAQQVFISIFTDAIPNWHCIAQADTSCNPAAKLCEMKEGSWAWDQTAQVSIVSEWNLQCSSPMIIGLPTSSHFIGCLMGGLALSTLADSSLGRKKTMVFSCLMMSLGGALAALSTDLWMYSALRFISGFGRATVATSALVLTTELIGSRWRGHSAVVTYSSFTIGFLSLPAFAYMCRGHSWRIMYLFISVPTMLYTILAHYFILDSPRWLLLHGKQDEAIRILRKLSRKENQTIRSLISMSQLSIMKELFPTCVRNSAMAMVRQVISIGSAITPLLVAALHDNWILQYRAFGLGVSFCGLFVVCLPETRGMPMCDTMQEQEHREKELSSR